MIALVTYPYRDRETLAVHLVGEEVERGLATPIWTISGGTAPPP